jgi:formate-dependent nitrite reductase membrane component NrfD
MYIVYFLSASIAGFKLNSAILLAGPALILAGLVLLFSELGKPSNFWRSVANYRTSWMARGAIFNFFYVAAGFGILLAESLRSYSFLPWIDATGFVIALLVLVYPGMLLRAVKDIPAWNSASTLAVTLIFALSGGGAAVILASAFIQPQALPEELVAVMVLNAFLIISGELYLKALRSLGSKKEGADLSYKEMQKKRRCSYPDVFRHDLPCSLYNSVLFCGRSSVCYCLCGQHVNALHSVPIQGQVAGSWISPTINNEKIYRFFKK